MTSIAELKQKEHDALRKARKAHRANIKKLDDAADNRVLKMLKKIHFFDVEFSDKELLAGFTNMLEQSGKVAAVTPSKALVVGPVKPS